MSDTVRHYIVITICIFVSQWFTLKETKSGRVHFRLEWLVLLPNTEQLEQVCIRILPIILFLPKLMLQQYEAHSVLFDYTLW